VVEDGYEFFARRQLVTIFSAPNYCGEFDNAGAMMSVDETLMCSFQILKPAEKKQARSPHTLCCILSLLASVVVSGGIWLHSAFIDAFPKPCALYLATKCCRNNMVCCRRSSCTLGWDDQGRHPGDSRRRPCAEYLGARHMSLYDMPSAHAAVAPHAFAAAAVGPHAVHADS